MAVSVVWPIIGTVVALGGPIVKISRSKPTGDYGQIGQGLGDALLLMFGVVASLLAWLVWALAR